MLAQAGIAREECYITNVLNLQPRPSNDIKNCCGPKAEGIPGMPAVTHGKYMRAEYKPELDRLYDEMRRVKPNLIVALGATAAWAFLKTSGIAKLRGAVAPSPFGKVLPTYHPQAVGYDWSLRPILFADLCKARREAEFPEVRRPMREVWIEPTITDLLFFEQYINAAEVLAIDIETVGDMITCIGFAPSRSRAIVVPFFDPLKPGKNYWTSYADELLAWQIVARWCGNEVPKVFQNGLFDINVTWSTTGIKFNNVTHDTMLLHHALQPELQKSLAFLGSIYTNEAAWKLQRRTSAKREE